MSMFCYQCQEAAKGTGCTMRGVCGKTDNVAGLQDLLIYSLKGLSTVALTANNDAVVKEAGRLVAKSLFMTITNANFREDHQEEYIAKVIEMREGIKKQFSLSFTEEAANWNGEKSSWAAKSLEIGILSQENEDVRSLRELLVYGLKGVAAYASHALVLGYDDLGIWTDLLHGMASTIKELSVEEMISEVLKAGELAVMTMALLDKANTETYGHPEMSSVNIGVGDKPGILISGHDLQDMEELLKQSEGSGVDIYTHSEMLPANYYPAFKKYKHLKGNYGNAWWKQSSEFETFNGPILMTTNCITPVQDSYKERIYTTGQAGYPGVKHIVPDANGKKDYSAIIEQAKGCEAPIEIETGEIVGGFAHNQVFALADKVVDAVKSGAIKRFVVMAGCDGRHKTRSYFSDVAENLPKDTVILTAGCAKYRYNKLNLGDIGGIPRVLDAGQCNDSYSLALIALKLKEVFNLEDINDLPISFDIAWYEQKAVAVLLALLHLGFKGLRLGPTLPAFLSPNVAKVLIENFDIKGTGEVSSDIEAMMLGK